MYQLTISSSASGTCHSFSLSALPNPPEYVHDEHPSLLVPILVGMDYLGPRGVGSLVDFTTGLTLNTKEEENPDITQLPKNQKGRYVLDIVHHVARGHRRLQGNAHLVVSSTATSTRQSDLQVLEFHPLPFYFDLTVGDAVLEQSCDSHQSRRDIMRLLEGSRSHRGISSTMTAATSALMSSGDCITNPNSICDTPLITLAMARVPICQWPMSRCSKRRTSSRSSKAELHPRRELDHWMHVVNSMGDPRDPRIAPKQWPCFNRHVPVSRGNPHGMWEE